MFLYCFDVLILKIIKKIKNYYFDVFSSENTLKNNHCHPPRHQVRICFKYIFKDGHKLKWSWSKNDSHPFTNNTV